MEFIKDFQKCFEETEAWIFKLHGYSWDFVIIIVIGDNNNITSKNRRDTYFHGQIDAIRGIIKWKLERNKMVRKCGLK